MTSAPLEPTRAAGLERLEGFLPRAGKHYAGNRNIDRGAGAHTSVSGLSPYLRHRLVLEREVLSKVTAAHRFAASEKFISEVFWRTYFKGFLERRPSIWSSYKRQLHHQRMAADRDGELAADLAAAEAGITGIDAFDTWARELVATGYLHNHARMWFASIWIFTLRLPWEWGADFFLRHLLDGDPASNTLSWRWVGGLHTKGKTYLARPDNIEKFTEGRFRPQGLASHAPALVEDEDHPLLPPRAPTPIPREPTVLLLTEDDCAPETLGLSVEDVHAALTTDGRSDRAVSDKVTTFARGALSDALSRLGGTEDVADSLDPADLIAAAEASGTGRVTVIEPPVGPAADALFSVRADLEKAGITLLSLRRPEDTAAWVHADKGFFNMRKAIPKLMP